MERIENGLSIRIKNDGDYVPGNIRWASSLEQNNNKRNNVRFEFASKSLTMPQWSALTGIAICTIRRRIDSGWTVEAALTRAVRKSKL